MLVSATGSAHITAHADSCPSIARTCKHSVEGFCSLTSYFITATYLRYDAIYLIQNVSPLSIFRHETPDLIVFGSKRARESKFHSIEHHAAVNENCEQAEGAG